MFDFTLDFERSFDHHSSMPRTGVRPAIKRRRALLGAASVLVVALMTGPVAHAAGHPKRPDRAQTRNYVVRPGDTLWVIATRSLPGVDPRRAITAIELSNGLTGPGLVPGQALRIPASA
jgi:nucleoid-associated protein YgaU